MKKYKIVVLSNLDSSAHITLKSTVSLAKMIDGNIEVFSVIKPTEVVNRESQLSAIRTINRQSVVIDKKMQNLISPISQEYTIDITSSYTFGNVKNEISDFIADRKPDIIVLGKRKEKLINFIGDRITQFVLNTFKGTIMIATDKNALEPNKRISLGTLNNLEESFNLEFAKDLMDNTQKPLKSFKIVKNSGSLEEVSRPVNKDKVEYVFEYGDGAINGLSNYLDKNKINLLYINRANDKVSSKVDVIKSNVQDIVDKLDVTLLLTGEQSNNTILTN